jgi:tetratricopeptide (TPR) repeat protein
MTELSQEQFERIERYCLDHMSSVEKNAFETELNSNPDLKNEVEVFRQSVLAIKMNAFKNSLQNITESNTDMPKMKSYRWLYAAASVVVLLSAGWYFFLRTSESDRLFAQYAMVDPGLPVPMSATDNFAFHDAMVDYKNEQYEKAINKWSSLLQTNPQNDTLIYYIGMSHFNSTDYSKAIAYFDQVVNMRESVWVKKSELYQVLAFLKTKQFDRIHKIAQSCDGPYCDSIKKIRADLK